MRPLPSGQQAKDYILNEHQATLLITFLKNTVQGDQGREIALFLRLKKGSILSKYTDFKAQVIGKGFDVDGAFSYQCWDGYAQYCKFLGVPYANCTTSGYVKDIWNNRHSNGILNYFDEVSVMEPGDIAVFKEVAGVTPVSHIAIFDSDIDGIRGNFLGQNQGGAGGVFNITTLPYSATFDTAFRLKSKSTTGSTNAQKGDNVPTKNINGDTYSGLITSANPNVMYSSATQGVTGYDRLPIDRIVIHHNATTSKDVAMNTWTIANGKWTSAHYEITPNEIIGCVGEQYSAFHSGDATMNRRSIGLEHLNETGAPEWKVSDETLRNSAKLIADIAKRYNIPIDSSHIIPHKQVSATACPGGIDMAKLIRMAQEVSESGAVSKSESTSKTSSFRVKVSISDLNIRKSPSLSAGKNGVAKSGVYTIVDTKQADGYEWGKLKSGAGWIALKYTEKV